MFPTWMQLLVCCQSPEQNRVYILVIVLGAKTGGALAGELSLTKVKCFSLVRQLHPSFYSHYENKITM